MSKCQAIKKNINKICSADLNQRIKIQTSYITASNAPNTSAGASFVDISSAWAMIKTTPSTRYIDGVNVEVGISTDFYIRYNSIVDVAKQLWIEWNSKKFRVINVDNINKDNLFMRFRAVEEGDKTINVNLR